MNLKNITLIFILFVSSLICSQTYKSDKKRELTKYASPDLSYDAAILKDALKKIHPGLFRYLNEEQFENGYKQFLDSLRNPLSEWEFHKHVLDFIADIRCGHTQVSFSEKTNDYLKTIGFFPFGITVIDSSIFIRKNFTKAKNADPGAEILSINNTSSKEVIERIKRYCWADGFYQSPDLVESDFPVKLALVFGTPESFRVQLRTQEGITAVHDVPAITDKEVSEIERAKYPDKFTPWTFNFDSASNTAILGNIVFDGKRYKRFLESSFGKIDKLGATNLIIDLRDNGGGEDEYPLWLYQYIAEKPFWYYEKIEAREVDPDDTIFKHLSDTRNFLNAIRSNHFNKSGPGYGALKISMHNNLSEKMFTPKQKSFKGNVYLIVNSGSFSASTEFAAVAHSNRRCTVIGQETMGAYCGNNSGDELMLTLPKTGTKVFIPAYSYFSSCKECPYGRGIVPDHLVSARPSDFAEGDSVLEFTLNLIKQSNK